MPTFRSPARRCSGSTDTRGREVRLCCGSTSARGREATWCSGSIDTRTRSMPAPASRGRPAGGPWSTAPSARRAESESGSSSWSGSVSELETWFLRVGVQTRVRVRLRIRPESGFEFWSGRLQVRVGVQVQVRLGPRVRVRVRPAGGPRSTSRSSRSWSTVGVRSSPTSTTSDCRPTRRSARRRATTTIYPRELWDKYRSYWRNRTCQL